MNADRQMFNAVYANSFYAALNTRRSVRGRGTENERTTVPTFLMVGQTTTFKNEAQEAGNVFSTVRGERAREPAFRAVGVGVAVAAGADVCVMCGRRPSGRSLRRVGSRRRSFPGIR